jgi:hypothetical protein
MSPRGGKRPGAGRPRKPATRVLSFRVPSADYDRLRAAVLDLLAKLLR